MKRFLGFLVSSVVIAVILTIGGRTASSISLLTATPHTYIAHSNFKIYVREPPIVGCPCHTSPG